MTEIEQRKILFENCALTMGSRLRCWPSWYVFRRAISRSGAALRFSKRACQFPSARVTCRLSRFCLWHSFSLSAFSLQLKPYASNFLEKHAHNFSCRRDEFHSQQKKKSVSRRWRKFRKVPVVSTILGSLESFGNLAWLESLYLLTIQTGISEVNLFRLVSKHKVCPLTKCIPQTKIISANRLVLFRTSFVVDSFTNTGLLAEFSRFAFRISSYQVL